MFVLVSKDGGSKKGIRPASYRGLVKLNGSQYDGGGFVV